MVTDLVKKNRSYRRFDPSCTISKDDLESFVQLAQLSPSAGNMQPLRYVLSCDPSRS